MGVFEDKEYLYIVMEHCAGGDLFDFIVNEGVKTPPELEFNLIHQIFQAIHQCHSNGIIHLDVKPENFLLSLDHKSGTPILNLKLTDFGAAVPKEFNPTIR